MGTIRRLAALLLLLFASSLSLPSPVASGPIAGRSPAAPIHPVLAAEMATLPPQGQITAIVRLHAQPAAEMSALGGPLSDGASRLQSIITSRQDLARTTQAPLLAFLATRQAAGAVSDVTPFWIINGLAITATPAAIDEVARRPEVASIGPDWPIAPAGAAAQASVPANLALLGAPVAWKLGLRGEGLVIATLDTGGDLRHPDLAASWLGGPSGWYDPFGEHTTPADLSGHGTNTLGVIVGGAGGGQPVGVAPAARWMAARIFNDRGLGSSAGVHLAFQWLLDPDGNPATADAPHIVNHSWTMVNVGCNEEFLSDVGAVFGAGIEQIFAAGNFGPNAATSASPANYPYAFAVGATDNADAIASMSSRGPANCGGVTRTFPDLAAPGVSVLTTGLAGGYLLASGTSLAAPQVAAGLGVLQRSDPSLYPDELRQVLLDSAVDLGAPGPDNAYGAGRLDLRQALRRLAIAPRRQAVPSMRGSFATYTFTVRNPMGSAVTYNVLVESDLVCQADPAGALTLPAESSRTLTVRCRVPWTSEPTDVFGTYVTVSPTAGGPPAQASVTTELRGTYTLLPLLYR